VADATLAAGMIGIPEKFLPKETDQAKK